LRRCAKAIPCRVQMHVGFKIVAGNVRRGHQPGPK
jgi:hypothetical protein